MAKRIVIVHGWRGRADRGWLAWLADELRARGYEVVSPQLKNRTNPKMSDWLDMMRTEVGRTDANTVFVGHSLGTRIILKYLEEEAMGRDGFLTSVGRVALRLPRRKLARGVVLVAGFYDPDDPRSHDYLGREPRFDILKQVIGKSVCIYSDNDKLVRPAASKKLAEALGATEIEVRGRGHFGNSEDKPLEDALMAVLNIIE